MPDPFDQVFGDQPRGRADYEATEAGEIELQVVAEVDWVEESPLHLPGQDPDDTCTVVDTEGELGGWYSIRDWREATREAERLRDELFATWPDRPGLRKRAQGYLAAYRDGTGHDILPVGSDWTGYQPSE